MGRTRGCILRESKRRMKTMPRAHTILLSTIASWPLLAGIVDAAPRTPDGADIPELTVLFQTIVADTTESSNFVSTLSSAACSGFSTVSGPDLVYTWLAQTSDPNFPLHLDFLVTPQSNFDTVVYALSELDDGSTCVAATDQVGAGRMEMLHVEEQLVPGHRYYLYIDSRSPTASAGQFQLHVSTFVPVELQSFSIE